MKERFYIVHLPTVCGDSAVFWRPNRDGYTYDLSQAGVYTAKEAEAIEGIRGQDKRVPVELAEELAQKHVPRGSLLQRIGFYSDGTLMEDTFPEIDGSDGRPSLAERVLSLMPNPADSKEP